MPVLISLISEVMESCSEAVGQSRMSLLSHLSRDGDGVCFLTFMAICFTVKHAFNFKIKLPFKRCHRVLKHNGFYNSQLCRI